MQEETVKNRKWWSGLRKWQSETGSGGQDSGSGDQEQEVAIREKVAIVSNRKGRSGTGSGGQGKRSGGQDSGSGAQEQEVSKQEVVVRNRKWWSGCRKQESSWCAYRVSGNGPITAEEACDWSLCCWQVVSGWKTLGSSSSSAKPHHNCVQEGSQSVKASSKSLPVSEPITHGWMMDRQRLLIGREEALVPPPSLWKTHCCRGDQQSDNRKCFLPTLCKCHMTCE